jgi:type 1 glutamine amidotransferase
VRTQRSTVMLTGAAFATLLAGGAGLAARQPTPAVTLGTSASLEGFLTATLVFGATDADKDGLVSREELSAAAGRWFSAADAAKSNAVSSEQLTAALDAAMPRSGLAAAFNMGGRGAQPQAPHPATVAPMMAALPERAPVRPQRPRRVLVLARAAGFVHSSIPLAAKTIEALGTKTGAWSTTITYDAADVTAENLKQYDAVFLASTTGAFLDDPADGAVTARRRQALLDFVRGGKGLAGIHAASDSYHRDSAPPAAAGGGFAGVLSAFSAGSVLAPVMLRQGDRNGDRKLDRPEVEAVADAWFRTLDKRNSGRLTQADFSLFALMIPHGPAPAAVPQGPDTQVGTWPEFNRMIGGFFKYHWLDPQQVTVRIDDPASPLTAMFKSGAFDVHDEIYTMSAGSWSRDNVRVLTSIDYQKMSAADRALEEHPRPDRDYGLSWIRREGQGRVFYEALGHSERIYAIRPLLEHLLAGMQYVLGDLQADDTPVKR